MSGWERFVTIPNLQEENRKFFIVPKHEIENVMSLAKNEQFKNNSIAFW
jgi:hypothetical protein